MYPLHIRAPRNLSKRTRWISKLLARLRAVFMRRASSVADLRRSCQNLGGSRGWRSDAAEGNVKLRQEPPPGRRHLLVPPPSSTRRNLRLPPTGCAAAAATLPPQQQAVGAGGGARRRMQQKNMTTLVGEGWWVESKKGETYCRCCGWRVSLVEDRPQNKAAGGRGRGGRANMNCDNRKSIEDDKR